jgi:enoyl-CoA hydratase/carnithine racemase
MSEGFETIPLTEVTLALTITIDRAAERNTITYGVLDELLVAFARADADPAVRVVIVTGDGEFFSAGTDLSSGGGGFDRRAADFEPLRGGTRDVGGELALRIFASTKPVIAAVNGTAVGIGVTMILPMDIRIGAEGARFGSRSPQGIVPSRAFVPAASSASPLRSTVRHRTAVWPPRRWPPGWCASWCGGPRPRPGEGAGDIATSTSAVSVALT